ncbi:hypothetical protein CONPUDRAFT_40031, partial [Coniophora puteana RWD-64-598 SS2]
PWQGGKVDEVFQNIVFLNRDLLIFYDLIKGISSGNFGRLELYIGALAATFSGGKRYNYMGDTLHLLQNLKKIWTPDFAF